MKKFRYLIYMFLVAGVGCGYSTRAVREKPALDYARSLEVPDHSGLPQVRYAGDPGPDSGRATRDLVTPSVEFQDPGSGEQGAVTRVFDYREPNYSPSLYRENHGDGALFRDFRAWKPMDLVTILVTEVANAAQNANTQVDSSTTLGAAVTRFLGIETSIADRNTQLVPTALVDASTTSEFDGQGITRRSDNLTGTISAMVHEVLPSGVLRIEGKKIISVNSEERTMIISGLVRPQDIDSLNQIRSTQIANMRIDYFGNGVLSEVQSPGIITRIFNKIWPF